MPVRATFETAFGRLDDDVILLQPPRILQFVVFLCKFGLLFFKPQQD